jgi:hypothetical protein
VLAGFGRVNFQATTPPAILPPTNNAATMRNTAHLVRVHFSSGLLIRPLRSSAGACFGPPINTSTGSVPLLPLLLSPDTAAAAPLLPLLLSPDTFTVVAIPPSPCIGLSSALLPSLGSVTAKGWWGWCAAGKRSLCSFAQCSMALFRA